ncbi:MAG: DNA topoisomerase 4 subunit A [Caldilineaceae bacterium SB0662_bin_9]|uniref:DNA topoisomerase (ATP-hydrolyzing) n=1 Tax=Caldilineaceae bacterium SB0662_bin_9 TaxID=2605258 RepID=A0A6B1DSW4_9CHLR|nr:DNA topoisomerase 4 subunit A [Caldilineaceae bacterium]MYD90368.1 DNA topoisomerase 4 subunit A [Caldilineaceae bacterium SB0662_bin_9]
MANGNDSQVQRPKRRLRTEMETSYLDYAMSVIVARALPDVRDGLKPVQRRILHAMHHDLNLRSNGPFRKSARIVGEVLGKYHPHSDQSVYDAMMRLAQDFSLRYPVVDGQGNLGSIDGDNPAAMRYTEARLSAISALMLTDIEKNTVDWVPNFDQSLEEPTVLTASLPNLLVNGSNGIAVGMATQVPPHNLGEVCAAVRHLLDRWEEREAVTVTDLMQHIQGPDFPTGGTLFRLGPGRAGSAPDDRLRQAYESGRGRATVRAKVHVEDARMGRQRIVVYEIPYQTNKTSLLERIADCARNGQITGISDLRDESDRAGMRICVDLVRGANTDKVIADLFSLTPMEQTFSISLVALVNGRPERLNLKKLVEFFIEHRVDIVRRRSRFDLDRAERRAHIVEGLLMALDQIDEVIRTIRSSRSPNSARNNLIREFGFTEAQSRAVLAMPLGQLVAMERSRLRSEFKDLAARIKELQALLASDRRIRDAIADEMDEIQRQFADPRRTEVKNDRARTPTAEELEPDRTVWVCLGRRGTVRRYAYKGMQTGSFRDIGRNGGIAAVATNTRDALYVFSSSGRVQRMQAHRVPQTGRAGHVADLTSFTRRDRIVAGVSLPRDLAPEQDLWIVLVTEQGLVKKLNAHRLAAAWRDDLKVVPLAKGDSLIAAMAVGMSQELMLFSRRGKTIRFEGDDLRPNWLLAQGVRGIRLDTGDGVATATAVSPAGSVLTVTEQGMAKRTELEEFKLQARGGSGLTAHKLDKTTGLIAGALVIGAVQANARISIGAGANIRTFDPDDIPLSRRNTKGRRVLKPRTTDSELSAPAGDGNDGSTPQTPDKRSRPARATGLIDSVTLIWSDRTVDGQA